MESTGHLCQSMGSAELMDARLDGAVFQAEPSAPCYERQDHAILFYHHVASLIQGLFRHGGPLHVAGLIALIILFPFQGVCRGRSPSDISQEHSEVIPKRTDGDTPRAVHPIAVMLWIEASASHGHPASIFRRASLFFSCQPMLDPGLHLIGSMAPTTAIRPTCEHGASHHDFFSALAQAEPEFSAFVGSRWVLHLRHHREASELHARLNELWLFPHNCHSTSNDMICKALN